MSQSMFDLSGRVALVSGAGSGMGRSISEAMAEAGADVACVDIRKDAIEETAGILKKSGHGVLPITADVFDEADIKRMLDETVKKFGKLDIVFAHAAIVKTRQARIHEVSVEEWDDITSRYMRGLFLTMKYTFPIMMKQKSGCFITTAAATGIWPMVPVGTLHFAAPYITGKAAAIMLTKLAARHYGEYGIRANIICPGYHRSLHHTSAPGMDDMEKFVVDCTALKRTGVPDDIKGLATYLASDASRFITGQTFIEDGGMVI